MYARSKRKCKRANPIMKKRCEGKEYRQCEELNGTNLRIEKHKRTKQKDAAEQKRNF